MSFLLNPFVGMLAGGVISSFLQPKPEMPSVPSVPNITIKQLPPAVQKPELPDNPPLSPDSITATAAQQRARANRAIRGGPSSLVLTSPKIRSGGDSYVGSGTGSSSAGLVSRTSLLGR